MGAHSTSAVGGGAGVVAEVEAWLMELAAGSSPRGPEAVERARRLVAELDHPQRAAPAIHVVGTAGKGMVVEALGRRAVAGGRRVATHQSPHVFDIRERFLVDLAPPSDTDLAVTFAAVRLAAEAVAREIGPPSFFAATAALSWELGRRSGVDLFVTEAGIGGRHDATAVLDRADTLTVVTAIGLDHLDVLGPTVGSIATEKAAVLAGRSRAVLGPQPYPEAAAAVRERAAMAGCELVEVDPTGDWRTDAAATAEAAGALLGFDPASAEPARPPGRYDVRHLAGRRVILDGAHNPLKLAALADTLAADDPPAVALVALGAAKDLAGCADEIARFGCPVVTTAFGPPGGPPSHPAAVVAAALRDRGVDATAAPDLAAAARRVLSTPGPVVVTGSFLFLADAHDALAG